ncbi:CPXV053 protein [Cowpox virus]|uniref:Protein OPG050 n=1 Tax=Cowpox virus TaxID=10243 RepID=A0A212Q3P9_COWPX|nr:CPXV053 protein [Cowpox virus]SNB53825.1 CPXV053 protein [Cowpox virus]
MSKILTFVKNKIIDLIKNDQIKYSRVITIEESDSLLPVDEVYANHGFDCVEMIDENIRIENLEQYKTDSFFTIN